MKFMRILGLILILAGIASIGTSMYIKNEIEKGKMQIAVGQKRLNQGKQMLNLAPPATKPVQDVITSPIQSKIDQGKRDVAYYETMSNLLMGGGIISIVLGILLYFVRKKAA